MEGSGRAVLAVGVMVVVGTLFVVGCVAWVLMVFYSFRTVTRRKPGVGLWRNAPAFNPFNHIWVTENLTLASLKYRRRLLIAFATFALSVLVALRLGAVIGIIR